MSSEKSRPFCLGLNVLQNKVSIMCINLYDLPNIACVIYNYDMFKLEFKSVTLAEHVYFSHIIWKIYVQIECCVKWK